MHTRSIARLLVSALLATAAACGSSSSASSTTPTENRSNAPAPVGERAVVLHHGPMTYVMDTVPNQVEKAQAALAESDLVAQLTGAGIAVSYQGDEALSDTVIVLAGDHELGRVELRELDNQPAPAALLDAIHAHFGDAPQ